MSDKTFLAKTKVDIFKVSLRMIIFRILILQIHNTHIFQNIFHIEMKIMEFLFFAQQWRQTISWHNINKTIDVGICIFSVYWHTIYNISWLFYKIKYTKLTSTIFTENFIKAIARKSSKITEYILHQLENKGLKCFHLFQFNIWKVFQFQSKIFQRVK